MQTKSKTVDAYRSVCAATERVIVCKSLSGTGHKGCRVGKPFRRASAPLPAWGYSPPAFRPLLLLMLLLLPPSTYKA